jgi:hypothetical protein
MEKLPAKSERFQVQCRRHFALSALGFSPVHRRTTNQQHATARGATPEALIAEPTILTNEIALELLPGRFRLHYREAVIRPG